ncbi:MAG: hypothetical protein Q9182_003635 [Xanthomendoza sp. 2 TL-2023]
MLLPKRQSRTLRLRLQPLIRHQRLLQHQRHLPHQRNLRYGQQQKNPRLLHRSVLGFLELSSIPPPAAQTSSRAKTLPPSSLDFCCDHSTDCCDTGSGRFRLPAVGNPTTTIHSNARTATRRQRQHPSPTNTAKPTSKTPSPPPRQPHSSPSRLSTGAKAGIGGGAALVVVVVIAIISFILWKKKRNRTGPTRRHELPHNHIPRRGNGSSAIPPELSGTSQTEMPTAENPAWEMPGSSSRRN